LTSSKAAQKAMGKNWKKLHRFIYTASVAVIIHYFWQLKGNLLEPIFYTIIVGLLLLFRVTVWLQNKYLSKLMVPKSRKQDD
jgi:sulfoxide reductase heme-binding subunit YedZ